MSVIPIGEIGQRICKAIGKDQIRRLVVTFDYREPVIAEVTYVVGEAEAREVVEILEAFEWRPASDATEDEAASRPE